jgi:hypothetical protein
MKKLIVALMMVSTSAFAVTLADIAGTYEITSDDIPVVNMVEINEDGSVSLSEQTPYGSISCRGNASIADNTLESKVACDNGIEFVQRVNLEGIESFEEFTANVFSSLYGQEIPMNFIKID